jgi:hypothetical protein
MKTILTLLILFSSILFCFGQYIPFPTNATWTEDYGVYDQSFPPQPPIHNYKYYGTNGDTTINGLIYTKISTPYNSSHCNLRDSSGIVFCKYNQGSWYDTTEFILYNFNLALGDSTTIPILGNPITYQYATVYDIDFFMIGFQSHKRIRVSGWFGNSFDYVEGVGSPQGLLYPENSYIDSWNDLYCFSRNDTIMYNNLFATYYPGNCWITTDIENTELKQEAKSIYPNPTNNVIHIDNEDLTHVEVYNIFGQKLIKTTNSSIKLKDFEDGTYFIRTTYIDETVINSKVIKQSSNITP